MPFGSAATTAGGACEWAKPGPTAAGSDRIEDDELLELVGSFGGMAAEAACTPLPVPLLLPRLPERPLALCEEVRERL